MPCALPIRSEEHTSELQSHDNLVCRLLLEKKQQRGHNSWSVPCTRSTPRPSAPVARALSALGAPDGRWPVPPCPPPRLSLFFFLKVRRPPKLPPLPPPPPFRI